MPPNPDFNFSQSSLQDYLDCPRRFELRCLLKQKWPALHSEPALEQERHLLLGHRFHQLVHQHQIGIPVEQLSSHLDDPDLLRWWQNYLQANLLARLPKNCYPEYQLSAPFEGHRLVAQYDLLAIQPGEQAIIVDWKTTRQRLPSAYLKKRAQSRLYPFLLCEAGDHLNRGEPFTPSQVEMIYWFPERPHEPERLQYSPDQFENDRQWLQSIAQQIDNLSWGGFALTANEALCKFCTYRSLCKRGVVAGDCRGGESQDFENQETPIEIDFDQIGEIAF